MKKLAFSLLTISVLGLFGNRAFATDPLEAPWLRLIKADFKASCTVERFKVGIVFIGNNGHRSEQWFMHTCLGNFEYQVEYYPPSAFPGRTSPYQIKRIKPAVGKQAVTSFKP